MSGAVISRPIARKARMQPAGWLSWLALAIRTMETRRHLARMDERMLQDIGVSRTEALEEASRSPWDLDPLSPQALWMWR